MKATGPYVNRVLAGEETRQHSYTEAIVLNKEGNVAEGLGENLVLVDDDDVYTPWLAASVPDGITPASR